MVNFAAIKLGVAKIATVASPAIFTMRQSVTVIQMSEVIISGQQTSPNVIISGEQNSSNFIISGQQTSPNVIISGQQVSPNVIISGI